MSNQKTFEYKVIACDKRADPWKSPESLHEILNLNGKTGWELVAVVQEYGKWFHYFKRETSDGLRCTCCGAPAEAIFRCPSCV